MVQTIPISLSEGNLSEDALEVIKKVRPSWDFTQVKFKVSSHRFANLKLPISFIL